MFLSRLILGHPPRNRQLRRDLAWPYEMHRTLMRAFPDNTPGDGERVLFRLEPIGQSNSPVVIVQSEQKPKWDFFSEMPGYLAEAKVKPFQPIMLSSQICRFRLRANPTRKVGTSSRNDRIEGQPKDNGRRIGLLTEEQQRLWLNRKGENGGFLVHNDGLLVIQEDPPQNMVKGFKGNTEAKSRLSLLSVRFEGTLAVTDPETLTVTLGRGIGPGKAFGFGLLSLAPV